MEDRKRSAGHGADDLAPPTKRQAVNGSSKSSADNDMPWKDDLEKYQKDAIYRQMLEYKREKATLESQLKELQKRSADHDDHLRVIDAWWSQLLDEVKFLAENEIPHTNPDVSLSTALSFKGSEEFSSHLSAKSKEIKAKLQAIFSRLATSNGEINVDVQDLQTKINKLIASHKELMVKVDRLQTEKNELSERLETASLRYIKAEKRLDRAKSTAVAKLEAQAIAGTGNSAGSGIGGVENGVDTEMTNGIAEERGISQSALNEATATVAKQQEQLDKIMEENKGLTEQLTAANTKLSNLNEDDYARTELFKQFRSQHEEVIKRINHLEATNIQLREEAEKYQAERTAYRAQLESESESAISDIESQLQRVEADLTRVRSARDELLADLSVRKASQEQEKSASDQLKELVGAKDDRITALESEIERLRAQCGEHIFDPAPSTEIESMSLEELRKKYQVLEHSFSSINKEMPALQNAYTRVMALSNKKVMDFAALEEKVSILLAEKAKADQKYFAARKDMDTRIGEVRTLRAQNAKSSEIITQLKEVETSNRTLLSNLEKQLSDLRQANNSLATENKKHALVSSDAASKAETLRTQVADITNLLKAKDGGSAATKQRLQSLELEVEQLRVRYEQAQKDRDLWKAKSLSNQSGEEEMLRTLALCTICRKDFKNTILKTCGHLFCNNCVEDRIANRMRKCPNCAKSFDKMDVMTAHM
ncbi:hypothetical protein B7463_g9914, partial [Scytalidium lignicola]